MNCVDWFAYIDVGQHPLNVPQRTCFGFGECLLTDDGQESRCLCDSDSQRYGPFCQFEYGMDPVASIVNRCRDCEGDVSFLDILYQLLFS